mmetsp:Transcript_28526/g.25402  ORF Transcript_28526/g.25402 Transcript_28526/m.25402 type:complete len:82 (-) Transcript_28526:465-710(-)
MGDVDKLFYDLEKNIEISVLQRMHEDFVAYMKNQEKKNKLDDDLENLSEIQLSKNPSAINNEDSLEAQDINNIPTLSGNGR